MLGNHLEGRLNEDIVVVQTGYDLSMILFPPIGFGIYFPNMESFKMTACNLEYIKPNDFKDMTKLKEIHFTLNSIKEIPPATFDDLTQLENLQLDSNQLARLPDRIFHNLVNLETINLYNNKLETLSASLFATNLKLKTIRLDINNLISIELNTFAHLSNIRHLYADFNPCFTILPLKKLPDEIAELDAILAKECNKTCEDYALMLSVHKSAYMECEEEFDKVVKQNVQIRNEQKACLLL